MSLRSLQTAGEYQQVASNDASKWVIFLILLFGKQDLTN